MIELKLRDLLDSMNVLRELGQKQLKGRTAYTVAKILRQVENEFSLFNETRQKLVNQYGAKDENGNLKINPETNEYIFENENVETVMNEINTMLDSNVSLNANKIKLSDIEDLDFTPAEMAMIDSYIEE